MKGAVYKKKLKQFARENRNNATKGEAVLWKYVLRAKKTGFQFNRQFVIDDFIVDFICRKLDFIIEVDGSSHYGMTKEREDYDRQIYLEKKGFTILRITEGEILKRLDDVVEKVNYAIYALAQEKGIEYSNE